jgi:hypothetical protein
MAATLEDLVNGLEHVLHEIRVLVGALCLARQRRMRLSLPPDALSPDLLSLAVRAAPIELPALHASHLLAFFAAQAPSEDHLLATQYFPAFSIDTSLRLRLDALAERVEAQVAPLTASRVSREGQHTGPHSYSFPCGEFSPLFECCRRFAAEVLESEWLDGAPALARDDWQQIRDALDAVIRDIAQSR